MYIPLLPSLCFATFCFTPLFDVNLFNKSGKPLPFEGPEFCQGKKRANPHPPKGRGTMTAVTEVPHVAGTVGEVGWGSSATELVLGRELLGPSSQLSG